MASVTGATTLLHHVPLGLLHRAAVASRSLYSCHGPLTTAPLTTPPLTTAPLTTAGGGAMPPSHHAPSYHGPSHHAPSYHDPSYHLLPQPPLLLPLQAAVACVDCMTPEEIASGRTFPELKHIRDVSRKVRCRLHPRQ